jgi:hypothetical protein
MGLDVIGLVGNVSIYIYMLEFDLFYMNENNQSISINCLIIPRLFLTKKIYVQLQLVVTCQNQNILR